MAAVIRTSDEAARRTSHEPELVAVFVSECSAMIEEATFPLPLGPMERWDESDCGFELLVGGRN